MDIDTELIGTIAWIVAASIGVLLACIFTWEIQDNIRIKKQERDYDKKVKVGEQNRYYRDQQSDLDYMKLEEPK